MRIVFILFLFIVVVQSQAQKRVYQTNRFDFETPKIDGFLDDKAWDVVEWSGDFTQFEPDNGQKPSQSTSFKIIYDDNYLYVAIRAFDSVPEEIVSRMSRRDGFEGDFVEINIDSHHDFITAYSFSATVAGVKADERITQNGYNWDDSWDPIWYLKTSIDDLGWIAEFKIPLTQLRFSSDSAQVWGLEVKRMLFRKDERSLWQAINNEEQGYVSKFGELHGLSQLKPKRQFDITPYVVGSYEHYNKEEGSSLYPGEEWKARAGVDAKIGLSNNITMDLTINPDFGQVEADPSEVNLTAFESYFEERRPFFVEGRNIYEFSVEPGDGDESNTGLFYSRRIGRTPQYYPDYDEVKMPENTTILGAAKISGKTKKGLSIGILESVTREEKAQVRNEGGDIEKAVVEPLSNYFVGRVEQEFDQGNTKVGGMFTSTNRVIKEDYLKVLPKNAQTGGVNFDHSWNDRKYNFSFKFTGSRVSGDSAAMMHLQTSSQRYYQRPDAIKNRLDTNRTSLSGHGGYASFGKFTHSGWNYMTWVNWISPGLELNDIGFMQNADNISQINWLGYTSPKPVGILRQFNVGFAYWNSWNFDRVHIRMGGNLNAFVNFTNYWYAGSGINFGGVTQSTTLLRGGPIFVVPYGLSYWMVVGTDRRKKIALQMHMSQTFGHYQYRKQNNFSLGITYRPSDRLKLSVEPYLGFNRNNLQYVTSQDFEGEDQYFLAEINQETFLMEFRIDYSFTPDLSLQYYGQPFVSTGTYSNYKWVGDSKAKNYHDRFEIVTPDENNGVDLDGDGVADVDMPDPDFKFVFFQSNMVLRWEYLPGSTVFLVWSQAREDGYFDTEQLPLEFSPDVNRMFAIFPHDVILLKFSYRIPI